MVGDMGGAGVSVHKGVDTVEETLTSTHTSCMTVDD